MFIPFLCLATLGCCLAWTGEPPAPETYEGPQTWLRVKLVGGAPELDLELDGAWQVAAQGGGHERVVRDLGAVTLDGPAWTLDGQRLPDVPEITITPLDPAPGPSPIFRLQGRRYRGELWIRRNEGRLRVINAVEVEDYLAGVLAHEMPIQWHDEALKAQAIAARSYALRNLRPKKDYDLESDTRSQVYGGVTKYDERAQQLVRATAGQVVMHEGRMVTTFFHSTCGGDTIPATWVGLAHKDTPPLMGATDCTCQPSKYYRYQTRVDFRKLKRLGLKLPLRELRVEHYPRGNYVRELVLVGAEGKTLRWHGYKQARSYLRLKSPAFTAQLHPGGYEATFKTRGWGHGVGMCQFGARGFAERGMSGSEIIRHFYPESEVAPYR